MDVGRPTSISLADVTLTFTQFTVMRMDESLLRPVLRLDAYALAHLRPFAFEMWYDSLSEIALKLSSNAGPNRASRHGLTLKCHTVGQTTEGQLNR